MQDFVSGFTSAFMINVNWASVGEFLGGFLIVIFGLAVFLLVIRVLSNLLISYIEKDDAKQKGSLEVRYNHSLDEIEKLKAEIVELEKKNITLTRDLGLTKDWAFGLNREVDRLKKK